MKTIAVGLLGIGTVGAGTYRILRRNAEQISARAGCAIEVRMVAARNLERARQIVGEEVELTNDPMAVIDHPDIQVVVEVIGGCTVARELVLAAIAQGKHVVTANKDLLARHGEAIFRAARENGVMVAYEGAVAVSIPIIKALREGLTANRIEWVAGIINGTTNFILSEMRDKGLDFQTVLGEAQRRGYAEADPRFDVEGIDAAHKLTLIAAIAFGIPLQFDKVHVEGIAHLEPRDFIYAEQLGYRIKLLGIARRSTDGIELRVHPALVPEQNLLASVSGAMNGIMVCGDASGVTMYYGAGAGSEETGGAVVADLVDMARLIDAESCHRVPNLGYQESARAEIPVLQRAQYRTRNYLRVPIGDRSGAAAHVLGALAACGVEVEVVRQVAPERAGEAGDLLILARMALEKDIEQAIGRIDTLPVVLGKVRRLRLEPLA